jgi:hypothetical protein
MVNYFLGVALVVAPVFIKTGMATTTVMSQEYFLVIISMLGVFLFGIPRIHINIKLLSLSLFALAFTTINPFGLFPFYQLMMSIAGVAWVALIYAHAENINLEMVKKCFAIACVVQSLWVIAQYYGLNPHAIWIDLTSIGYKAKSLSEVKVYGSIGNINHSAALIACTLPFLKKRYWILPSIALYLGDSSFPVICAFVGILALYSFKRENLTYLIYGAIALFLSALALIFNLIPYGTYFSDTGRIRAWKALLEQLGLQFYGKGLGYVPEVFTKTLVHGRRFYQMHNEWLELYAIGGLLAVGVGVFLILPVLKNRGNPEINACLIALAVNSLGNFTFHIAPLFMVFGTCYALQLAKE